MQVPAEHSPRPSGRERRRQEHCPSLASATARAISPSTSASSGRERRRAGKLKMQAQIRSLQQQVDTLRQQLTFYKALSEELAASRAPPTLAESTSGTGTASEPLVFDLFEDVATAHVGTQTDISVLHWQPDVFVAANVLLAGGDAAAGRPPCAAKANRTCHPWPATGGGSPITTPRNVAATASLAEEPEDVLPGPLQQFGRLQGTSDVLAGASAITELVLGPLPRAASSKGERASKTTSTLCESDQQDFNSQGLAAQCANASPRAFDAISSDERSDFNSQHLATSSPGHALPRAFDADCSSNQLDFNSQDLAAHCATNASPRAFDAIAGDEQSDFNSQDLAAQCAHASPRAFDAISSSDQPDFNSQDLAAQGALNASPRAFDAIAGEERYDAISEDASASKDFNSQELACTSAFYPGAEAVASAAPGSIGVGSSRTTPSTPGSSIPGSSNSAVFSYCTFNGKNASCVGVCDDNSGNMPCGRSATAQTQCGHFATVADFSSQGAGTGSPIVLDATPSAELHATSGADLSEEFESPTVSQSSDTALPYNHEMVQGTGVGDHDPDELRLQEDVRKYQKCVDYFILESSTSDVAAETLAGLLASSLEHLEKAKNSLKDYKSSLQRGA